MPIIQSSAGHWLTLQTHRFAITQSIAETCFLWKFKTPSLPILFKTLCKKHRLSLLRLFHGLSISSYVYAPCLVRSTSVRSSMGDHQGKSGAENMNPLVGVDLNLWPSIINVIVLTWTLLDWFIWLIDWLFNGTSINQSIHHTFRLGPPN